MSVQSLADHAGKRLVFLSIAGNPNVTDFDVEDLTLKCNHLQRLVRSLVPSVLVPIGLIRHSLSAGFTRLCAPH